MLTADQHKAAALADAWDAHALILEDAHGRSMRPLAPADVARCPTMLGRAAALRECARDVRELFGLPSPRPTVNLEAP